MLTAIIVGDYDLAEALEHHLKLLNIKTVARGRNGMEAFDLYRAYEPDFVYLDASMPIFDGFVVEKIRKQYPLARIIMMTADRSYETKQRLSCLGITEILYKPIEPQMLKNIIGIEQFKAITFGVAH
jgi:DNA-binding response OmpR family regulator